MVKAKGSPPSKKKANAREGAIFHKTLRKNRQVVPDGKPLPAGATHVEKIGDKGQVVLVRKRFSAV